MSKSHIWREQHKLKSFDVGANRLMQLKSLFYYLQEGAWNHANHLGFGYQDLEGHDLIWVLSRIKVRFDKLPAWGDNITIETWPKGMNRLFALRDFVLMDEDQDVLCAATSAWLTINKTRRRPQRFKAFEEVNWANERHGLATELDKIVFEPSPIFTDKRKVRQSEIDLHHHVNNAVYVSWITDIFFEYFSESAIIKEMQVNFESEAKLADNIVLTIHSLSNDAERYFIDCLNTSNDTLVFKADVKG